MTKRLQGLVYLRAFEAVARIGSVRGAAMELHVTPGAVSQQIRALQEGLGAALFARRGRTLQLTEAGQTLRRSVAAAFEELDGCAAAIATPVESLAARSLTVAVPPALAVSWLAPAMFEFAETAGLAAFRMLPAAEMAQVDWRECDVAVVYGNPPWPGCRWRRLADVVLRPVCSPRLLNGAAPLRAARDLPGHWLLHEDDGAEWRRWLAAAGVAGAPRRNAHFGSLPMALAAALEGRGVALVSDLPAQEHLRSGRLVRPFEAGVEASRSYYCLCAEGRAAEPLVARFSDWVTGRAQASRAPASFSTG